MSGIPISAETANVSGLDMAIIEGLEEILGDAFDEGMINEPQFRVALRTTNEIIHGGPIIAYLATLRDEARDAVKGLPELDPNNPAAIIKAQEAIGRFRHLMDWLKGSIGQKPKMPSGESPPDDA